MSALGSGPDFKHKYGNTRADTVLNALDDFGIKAVPVKTGRVVTAIDIEWWPQNEDELRRAFTKLQRTRVGRKARITGTVEEIAGHATILIIPAGAATP